MWIMFACGLEWSAGGFIACRGRNCSHACERAADFYLKKEKKTFLLLPLLGRSHKTAQNWQKLSLYVGSYVLAWMRVRRVALHEWWSKLVALVKAVMEDLKPTREDGYVVHRRKIGFTLLQNIKSIKCFLSQ